MNSRVVRLALLLLVTAIPACGIPGPWHAVTVPSPPWISPNQRATWEESVTHWGLMPVPPHFHYRLIDNGKPLPPNWPQTISAWLQKTPMWPIWQEQMAKDSAAPHLAFALVSLHPSVVLAWPSNTEPYKLGRHSPVGQLIDPGLPGLGQIIACATEIPPPADENIFFFSPEFSDPAQGFQTPDKLSPGSLRITLPSGQLLIERTSGSWRVTRQ